MQPVAEPRQTAELVRELQFACLPLRPAPEDQLASSTDGVALAGDRDERVSRNRGLASRDRDLVPLQRAGVEPGALMEHGAFGERHALRGEFVVNDRHADGAVEADTGVDERGD
ncbi:hypothetical protein HRD49_07870 [Corallococcus exiguus]|uniref:hypothetical protein n=1 Tax=Corallococcus exiguus TaxID=83462 RepID=UPI0015618189|nr:hypothetical protein [Corallococcus exiguus]NRD61669.1 hypothetical protein [Corallococcus exiguus]